MDTIKYIELLGDFKSDKIYYLYKTSSSEINLEILSQLQKYESSLDFFSYYTKNDIKNQINSINQLDKNLTSIFNDDSNNYISNIDKYISQISKIILILILVEKIREILNKFLLKSKQYLNGISNNYKIENIYQDKLLSLINNLQYNYNIDISSPKNPKILSTITDNKTPENFFNENKLSIANEDILSDINTPAFIEKNSNKDNFDNIANSSKNNITNKNDINLSFRDMFFIFGQDLNTDHNSPSERKSKNKNGKPKKKNNSCFKVYEINKRRSFKINSKLLNSKSLDEDGEIKMYCDFLLLVKKLYKSCLITAEERIEIKKLIISKSKKIISFYKKEYENIKHDYIKIANTIKTLL